MNKKSFIIILVLSVVITYGVAVLQFATGSIDNGGGLPFSFSSFNFLGSETNTSMLILDIIFWFVIILILWQIVFKKLKR